MGGQMFTVIWTQIMVDGWFVNKEIDKFQQ